MDKPSSIIEPLDGEPPAEPPATEISLRRERELIDELGRLVSDRVQSEDAIQQGSQARISATRAQFDAEQKRVQQRFRADSENAQTEHAQALDQIVHEFETKNSQAARAFDDLTRKTHERVNRGLEDSQQAWETSRAFADSSAVDAEQKVATELHEVAKQADALRDTWRTIGEQARRLLRRRGCRLPEEPPVVRSGFRTNEPFVLNQKAFVAAQEALQRMERLPLARVVSLSALFPIWIGVWIATLFPLAKILEAQPHSGLVAIAGAGAFGLVAAFAIYAFVQPLVRSETLKIFGAFQAAFTDGERAMEALLELAKERAVDARAANQRRQQTELQAADEKFQTTTAKLTRDRETTLRQASEDYQAKRLSLQQTRDQRLEETQRLGQQRNQRLKQQFDELTRSSDTKRTQELEVNRQATERSWMKLAERWRNGFAQVSAEVDRMNAYCDERFTAWADVDWPHWTPPRSDLRALRFGSQTLHMNMFPRGLSADPALQLERSELKFPAVLTFPQCPSLLLEAFGEGREVANRILQNVMLRFLTSLPAGKVRFTILDAVGLGRNFSAFMHLADFDEKLVNHRIWSEPGHIQQRLIDLTEHMQDVIQTYLRNEFQSIEEYNEHAGEVAEPYQILVVANFPAGFNDESAQRLVSIANSGARCGVYTLISTDSRLDLPRGFEIADLETTSATLQWSGDRFTWHDPVLSALPPDLEQPPADELFTEIVRQAGRHAKDAGRVEVPFGTVTPKFERWWTSDSRSEIEVPLGRAGASKLQYLRLGRGTSQHVLIAGKTGSGKSTLLHAMITNLSLHYSPNEVQFYLIDFKKGVEFKPYATYRLPHARVVAIESEREFGMSVLERLDQELRVRGDQFRQAGVQDIQGYRNAHPDVVMPRILLVIDEFQEFFVQDDKVAQDAALLLDRLVRQGRAFGIHVLLGSQTIAGAYSLARSTLGQMAVRIALQCSEADSHLILSEENTAARLLRRPGEAIYNDANGVFEGNHPFQVVWIAANECETYLTRLADLAASRNLGLPSPIVFEGSSAADPAENDLLRVAICDGSGSDQPARAWLGAAVSIKEPTSVLFRRQSGTNLLIVGQQEELALGVLANCVVSLAATLPSPPCWVLDGSRPESPDTRFWSRFSEEAGVPIRVAATSGVPDVLREWTDEFGRRSQSPDAQPPQWFLVVYNLSRFRELRRSEDDFGFSSSLGDDKPVSAARQFATLLREGPAVGMHILVWCDNQTTLNRWLDRQGMRDFDLRVLFPMGANDSSSLIDSPAAGRLGVNRALLHLEETGTLEKFRPYGIPSAPWLNWVRDRLREKPDPRSL